jgi:hypothetical protein
VENVFEELDFPGEVGFARHAVLRCD